MTPQTLEELHLLYNKAVCNSNNILDIVNNLYHLVSEDNNFEEVDRTEIDKFLRKLESSKHVRKRTFQMSNLLDDLAFVVMYIIIWVNSVHKLGVDISLTGRRKALDSEFTKALRKDQINDIFGLRAVLLNDKNEELSETKLRKLCDHTMGILTNENKKECQDFISWLSDAPVNPSTQSRIEHTLSLPFQEIIRKDYIEHPKENGYKSLHFIVQLEMFAAVLPGATIEIQFRSNSMHQEAMHGNANHKSYKENINEGIENVFVVDDFSKVHITGFTSNAPEDDIDGIHNAKSIINRRISDAVVFL